MEKLQFETSKFLLAGTGTLEIVPENLESKFVFKVFRESGISKFQKQWISSQNFDLIPTYGIMNDLQMRQTDESQLMTP